MDPRRPDSAFGKLQDLGVDGAATFQSSTIEDAGENCRIMSDRNRGFIRVQINNTDSLIRKIVQISRRIRELERENFSTRAQSFTVMNLARIYNDPEFFIKDTVFMQYIEDLGTTPSVTFEICDRRTSVVKLSVTIHIL